MARLSGDGFHLEHVDGVPVFRLDRLEQVSRLVHAIFTRQGGVSRPPFATLNLGHAVGDAPDAGTYAGFSQKKVIWMTLLISGGAAGLAGVIEVVGPIGQLLPSISPGYGFTAIIVAYVGRLHPLGVLFAGLLLALSYLGGESAQIELNLPLAVGGVFQGLLLFFLLACDVLIHYRPRLSPNKT